MNALLKIKNIEKQVEGKLILNDFTMDVKENEIHALLGPNGAGKTSLLSIILGISKQNKGTILLNNEQLIIPYSKSLRKKIGYLPDEPILINSLTGFENLAYMNHIYGNIRNQEELNILLEQNGLGNAKNELVLNYSKGMKQRLSLAIVDLYIPSLLILDEPTLGLDILGVKHLKKKLLNYKLSGVTILLTTHDIHFCQEIADSITLINNGENIDGGVTSEWMLKYDNIELAMMDKLKI